MSNGQDFVRERHFESLAAAVSTEFGNLSIGGGASYADFSGATSIASGAAGLVPAPPFGAENYFLRGDGNWASIVGGDNSEAYVLSEHVSTIQGGFWAEDVEGEHALRLRCGDYIYNFKCSNATYTANDGATNTMAPTLNVLGTTPLTVAGGIWYSVDEGKPKLHFRSSSFACEMDYDIYTWAGGNGDLVGYLPFINSATADVFGNAWTAVGNPAIVDYANSISGKALYFDGSSYLQFNDIETLLGADPFAIDFWATPTSNTGTFFQFFNKLVATSGNANNSWVCFDLYQGDLRYIGMDYPYSAIIAYPHSLNTHHHFALTYDGAVNRVFVDGQLLMSKNRVTSAGGLFRIGNPSDAPSGDYHYKGYIDHFRIFKGNAIWTENFTPPTASDYL